MSVSKNFGVAFAALAFGAISITGAQADTIPFNWALNYSYNPGATGIGGNPGDPTDYQQVLNSGQSPGAATNSYAQSGSWGSVSGYASADLATGTLKVQAGASSTIDSGAYPYMQTNAIFGDSFTTTQNGSPFTWNGSTATFNMALTGDNSIASSNDFAGAGGFVFLAILKKGTLDPSKPYIGSPDTIQYFEYDIGNPSLQIYYTDPNHVSTALDITAGYTEVPASISATFAPGGDFDWVLLLGASGQEGPGDSFNFDLSHTLTLSYVAPEGTQTVSDSGKFTNIADADAATDVPEPISLSIFGGGIAAIAAMRRRKKA